MVHYISKSQTNSSLADRERFFNELRLPENTPHVLLQTCDRIELYWGDGAVSEQIAHHLFSVVSGLDSSLVGECAIQGQVKNCYQDAAAKHKLSGSLHKLFQTALSVGKRVRTESAISQGAISHSQAVIECLIQEQIPLKNALITMLGINKLNEDIIKFLQAKGAMSIFLGNRYFEKAEDMAAKYECKAFRFDEMKSFMEYTDVLIAATSAPHAIVRPEHISSNQKILILDLAFPRDVDEQVGEMPNVTLYNLEDIKQRVDQNLASRQQKMKLALEIIDEEVAKFTQNRKLSVRH
ncbi:MAG TPA: glutamyl-tRNA reductase [Paludibacter sp.]|nr:glutamyl-tRNA reductase [Paludibacter sp.]